MDSFAESPGSWKGVKKHLPKKNSEQRVGTCERKAGGGATGAPVTELGYTHGDAVAVPEEAAMAT